MMQIGITGGIGSGKSTVAKIIECLGFPVYYADERARAITDNNPAILEQIASTFGETVIVNGELDRPALSALVFADSAKLQQLNNIIHPAVRADYSTWLENQSSPIVFSEIAILFETGRDKDFDQVVLVTAPKELRIQRVMSRSGLTANEVIARMAKQWTDEQKEKLAQCKLVNDGEQALIPQVCAFIKQLQKV